MFNVYLGWLKIYLLFDEKFLGSQATKQSQATLAGMELRYAHHDDPSRLLLQTQSICPINHGNAIKQFSYRLFEYTFNTNLPETLRVTF